MFVLACGAALYFSMRSHSWLGSTGGQPLWCWHCLCWSLCRRRPGIVCAPVSFAVAEPQGRPYREPAQSELANAIRTADFAAMRRILATHPNLKGRDDAGFDLLSYAVMETRLTRDEAENTRGIEAVRLLLDAGMAPGESRDPDGGSTFAAVAPNVFQPGPDGNVPNSVAAEVFRLFLEHGADPNTLRGKEPLIFSVWGNVDSVREMLGRWRRHQSARR